MTFGREVLRMILIYWDSGLDTYDMAKRTGYEEPEIVKGLHRALALRKMGEL